MMHIGPNPQAAAQVGTPNSHGAMLSPRFEDLALPLLDSVYNFAHWLVQNPADADDLVQETYLKALRGFSTFKSNSNFRAWMFRILKNTFLTSRARAKQHNIVPFSSEKLMADAPAKFEPVESILHNRSRLHAIQKGIQQLPLAFHEVVFGDVEGAPYQKIADILSIPIGTVMSRLGQARKAIRASLAALPTRLLAQAALIPSASAKKILKQMTRNNLRSKRQATPVEGANTYGNNDSDVQLELSKY
ncbi:MAG: sigma-70 family RNA polymerase sigma factor [Acidobacteria bacterium]|nr:sigma-70 family RNA polymerase sigma factor [Acidobacteriota bacterium]